MRKIIMSIFTVALLFSFVSCGSTVNNYAPNYEVIKDEWIAEDVKSEALGYDSVSPDDYLQYSQISNLKKEIYEMLDDAVKNGKNVVDISDGYYTADTVSGAYFQFLADHPQYFYITDDIQYLVTEDDTVTKILIKYTDGRTVDRFDDQGKLLNAADRKLIADRVNEFNSMVDDILMDIPAGLSDFELEKYLHDYLVDNLEYYRGEIDFEISPKPDYMTVYGGLKTGEGICQTYAKLMQYLCYCVGINASQVNGSSMEGEAHLWNTVEIGGEWYHLDVTWDDPILTDGQTKDYRVYDQFNRNSVDIVSDHIIEDENNYIPHTLAETYRIENYYYSKLQDPTSAPINYQKMADNIEKYGEKYAVIYMGYFEFNEKYFMDYFYNPDSVFNQYIDSMGYDWELDMSYIISGKCCYIPIVR